MEYTKEEILFLKECVFYVEPGYITSNYDDDRHYIREDQLRGLYQIPKRYCVIVTSRRGYAYRYKGNWGYDCFGKKFIVLRPRYLGDYREYIKKVIREFALWELKVKEGVN